MPDAIDVSEAVNSHKVGAAQIKFILWCTLLIASDGYDFGVLGNIGPSVIADWHIDRASYGWVVSIGVVGLMMGSLCFGMLADKIGRRKVIITGGFIFGLFTLISAWSSNVYELAALRFLAAIGMGAVNPNVIAYVAEYAPVPRRAMAITLTLFGFTGGGALASYIISRILIYYDWHMVLIVGGIIPIITGFLLIRYLPDSVLQLATWGGRDREIAALLSRMYPRDTFSPEARYFVPERKIVDVPMRTLFRPQHITATLTIWIVGVANGISIFFLGTWLPYLMHQAGLSVPQAVIANSLNQWGGVVGAIPVTLLLDRYGPIAVSGTFVVAAFVMVALGFSGNSEAMIMLFSFLAGCMVIGGQFGHAGLQGTVYPTAARSTGTGWAIGIQRIGGFIAPFAAGILIDRKLSTPALFGIVAVGELVAALSYGVLAYSRRGRIANDWSELPDPREQAG
jgi:MFS transporter, AAHS family, 4-hydroxybenzoate transporter